MADTDGLGSLAFFNPSPIFAALSTDKARRILLRGPNRIGKTRHACALIAQRALDSPGSSWRFVSPTTRHVQRVAGGYLAEFLAGHLDRRSYYVYKKGWNGGRSKEILLANGSDIELLSYEDPVAAHEGAELDGAYLDEPPPIGHLGATQSRLFDRRGQLIIGATMVGAPGAVDYLREMVEGDDPTPKDGRTEHTSGWVQYVGQLSIAACPWKGEAELADQLRILSASPWDYAQRALGAWEGVTHGRRFGLFTESNVSRAAPDGEVKIGLSFDHGEVVGRQHVLLFAWRGQKIWFLDEYTNPVSTTPETDAHEVKRMLDRHRIDLRSIDYAVGDSNTMGKGFGGWRVNDALESAFAGMRNRGRAPFRIVAPDKSHGHEVWQQRLINVACDHGHLKVHPRCAGFIRTLKNWKGGTRPGSDDGELVHAADCGGYAVAGSLGHHTSYARLRYHG